MSDKKIYAEYWRNKIEGIFSIKDVEIVKQDMQFCVAAHKDVIYKLTTEKEKKTRLLQEEKIINNLVERGFPYAPQFCCSNTNGDVFYSIQQRIQGSNAKFITTSDENEFLRNLRIILENLHGLSFEPVSWKAVILERYKKYLGMIALNKELPKFFLDEIDQYALRKADLMPEVSLSILHGDLIADNIMTDGTKINGLIDFEWSEVGDPCYDYAKLRFMVNDQVFFKKFPNELLDYYFVLILIKQISLANYLRKYEIWNDYLEKNKSLLKQIVRRCYR